METKICCKCSIEKELSEFHQRPKTQKPYPHCKLCQNAYTRDHYNKNKKYYKDKAVKYDAKAMARWREFKETLTCTRCPENHPAALDFHHTDGDKSFTIGNAVASGWGWDTLMAEVAKCIVLCSNCHRKHHWNERQLPSPLV